VRVCCLHIIRLNHSCSGRAGATTNEGRGERREGNDTFEEHPPACLDALPWPSQMPFSCFAFL
jgi:hypothetical protein